MRRLLFAALAGLAAAPAPAGQDGFSFAASPAKAGTVRPADYAAADPSDRDGAVVLMSGSVACRRGDCPTCMCGEEGSLWDRIRCVWRRESRQKHAYCSCYQPAPPYECPNFGYYPTCWRIIPEGFQS